jgi:hypothetical protein
MMRNALERFFDRANHLNGLLHHLETQLRWFRDSVRNQHGALIPHLAAGASLVIRDLTEWPSHGWAVYYSSGSFTTRGEEFLELVDLLTAREAAWAVAQGFEAIETCLKDLLATHYLAVPATPDADELRKQEPKLKRAGHHRGELEFWKIYVRRLYRSAEDVLAEVRRIAPQLTDAEQRNNYPRDVASWFTVISELRHAVVHSNLTISRGRWAGWTPQLQQLASTLFSGTHGSAGFELRPTVKEATEALTGLVEYGYAVFKALSIAVGSEWRVFPKQGEE